MAGAEERAFHLWAKEYSHKRQISFRMSMIQNIQAVIHSVLPIITNIIFFSAFLSSQTSLTVGNFLAFLAAFGTVNGALMSLSSTALGLLSIVPFYERGKPILEALPEVNVDRQDPGPLSGQIELNNVWFRYSENDPWVLKGITLRILPGMFVAIVGPSGQGKSTLMRLLLGFEEPDSGAIYYDGKNLETLDLRAVRRQIGTVLQHGMVTQGTIFSNIAGSANLSLDDAWEAARMAGLAQDIEEMPMGMNTMVPDGGGTLSGGQRQRLLIARALVRKPRILLFDEATSALDNETQAKVMQSISELKATRVVIAHRLSTVMEADLIVVLNEGQIVQTGTYAELMEQPGLFAELAQRQLV